jgi:hypothetical protein
MFSIECRYDVLCTPENGGQERGFIGVVEVDGGEGEKEISHEVTE